MNFATPEFLLAFLPLSLALFHLARTSLGGRAALFVIVACSVVFYGLWNANFLWLIVLSIVVNFVGADLISRYRSRLVLAALVALNVGALIYFKAGLALVEPDDTVPGWDAAGVILPLGISFFTFQQIGFLVDVFRREDHLRGPLHYAAFVTFFPQLVAGPIVLHRDIAGQLRDLAAPSSTMMQHALLYLLIGLSKKLLIADPIGRMIDPAWAAVDLMTAFDAWVAVVGYGFQLFYDFSAYSDMALGLGLLFGLRLPINFASPYQARTVTEFWRRWHITLGGFLRSYLYVPLGGNRCGRVRMIAALWITMLLGGLWHGIGLTFLLWGSIHAAALTIEKLLGRTSVVSDLGRLWTLPIVFVAWIPFRSADLSDTFAVLKAMIGLGAGGVPAPLASVFGLPVSATSWFTGLEPFALIALLAAVLSQANSHQLVERFQPRMWHVPAVGAAFAAIGFSIGAPNTFLYWAW